MALIKCSECGGQVSDKAPVCPHCGFQRFGTKAQPQPRKTSAFTKFVAISIVVMTIMGIIAVNLPEESNNPQRAAQQTISADELLSKVQDEGADPESRLQFARQLVRSHPNTPQSEAAGEMLDDLEEAVRVAQIGKQWTYRQSEDPMTSAVTRTASLRSINTHSFDFPYSGPQNATLQIRRHPRYGDDVIFIIERGQLMCSSYGECPVRVRFDEGQARTLRGNPPSDNSSEYLFIQGYADFVRRLASAKIVRIEANVFQQGAPIWEFDVEGFDASRLQ